MTESNGERQASSLKCPDDGTCHHGCAEHYNGACWRVFNAEPLSVAGWGEKWPPRIKAAMQSRLTSLTGERHISVEDVLVGVEPAPATDPVRAALVQMVEAAEACTTGKIDGPIRFHRAKAAGVAALAAEPKPEVVDERAARAFSRKGDEPKPVESRGGVPTEHGDRCDAGVSAAISQTYVGGDRADESLLHIRRWLKEPRGWWTSQDEESYAAALSNKSPAEPVEITDEQREQIVVAIQDHVMPRLSKPTSAEAGALREAVNRALSAALSPAEPVHEHEWEPLSTVDTGHQPPRRLWRCSCGNETWGGDDLPPRCEGGV